MRFLLNPTIVRDHGLVIFKPGKSLLHGFYGRMMITAEPQELKSIGSGLVPDVGQQLALDERIHTFLRSERVIKAAGGIGAMKQYMEHVYQSCQINNKESEGDDYHSKILTNTVYKNSVIRTCWHHDNKYRYEVSDCLDRIANNNLHQWVLESVKRALRLDSHHQVTWPELCWWAVIHNVSDLLPDFLAKRSLHQSEEKGIGGTTSEHSIRWEAKTSKDIVHEKIEQIKNVLTMEVDTEPPASFMLRPKLQRWQNAKWLQWVKSQPCAGCQRPADDPHHIIGHGQGGMGTKAHDLFTIPLCRECHDELHRDMRQWEQKHGNQIVLLFRFLDRSLGIGAIA
ncbi:DUF968 domain-containing protein [Photorhabdus temperata]|uniref:DUF968 domain-containing protein n=1 Tax=Photorhabdus temperata TaxID=574560 RepID=UPI00038A4925|nr:DUF968 domain-containing protein [Photorhabdus temperata]EQB98772.1 Qin prophage [Photorhabdus temperata subsp. temperata M1021]